MSQAESAIPAPPANKPVVSFVYSVKLFFIHGFFSGILSAIIYLVQNGLAEGLGAAAAMVCLAPLGQGGAFAAIGVMGYPFYLFLARRNFLGLGER